MDGGSQMTIVVNWNVLYVEAFRSNTVCSAHGAGRSVTEVFKMMIKIFTKGNDGKITMTPEELKSLLDEAYWEGYRANNQTITYTTPTYRPYVWDGSTITLNTEANSTVFVGNMES